jgi:hypothetical protein
MPIPPRDEEEVNALLWGTLGEEREESEGCGEYAAAGKSDAPDWDLRD